VIAAQISLFWTGLAAIDHESRRRNTPAAARDLWVGGSGGQRGGV